MSNIDKERQPESQNNRQNELNLAFDEFEPITPKKAVKTSETTASFFNKIKAIWAKKSDEKQAETFVAADENSSTEFESEPVAAGKTALLKTLPTRYRRLAISLAVLCMIIVLFLWLKPNNQPVDNLQSQENTLPIEFQPIEPNVAVEANTPPQINATAGNLQATNENATVNELATTAEPLPQDTMFNPLSQAAVDNTPMTADTTTSAMPTVDHSVVTAVPAAKPTLTEEQIKQIEQKAYEEEQARLVAQAKARAEQRARAEFSAKQQESRKAQAILNGEDIPVVEAKPTPKTTAKSTPPLTSSGGTTKVLTVPAGTSLMQVFRDNKLNIADVNAMTKANGAANALSRFKPGDKVSVNINSEGRVSELRLPNGERFIRQSNGSYIYKK